jgi:hypothetical protein
VEENFADAVVKGIGLAGLVGSLPAPAVAAVGEDVQFGLDTVLPQLLEITPTVLRDDTLVVLAQQQDGRRRLFVDLVFQRVIGTQVGPFAAVGHLLESALLLDGFVEGEDGVDQDGEVGPGDFIYIQG